jgi:hypothetical protein
MTLAYTLHSFIETIGFTKSLYKCHQTVGGTLCEWHGAAWNLGSFLASSRGLLQAHNSPFHVKHVCPEMCATTEGSSSDWLVFLAHLNPPFGMLEPQPRPQSYDQVLSGNCWPSILPLMPIWNLLLCWRKGLKSSHFPLQPCETAKNFTGFLSVALIILGYKFSVQWWLRHMGEVQAGRLTSPWLFCNDHFSRSWALKKCVLFHLYSCSWQKCHVSPSYSNRTLLCMQMWHCISWVYNMLVAQIQGWCLV